MKYYFTFYEGKSCYFSPARIYDISLAQILKECGYFYVLHFPRKLFAVGFSVAKVCFLNELNEECETLILPSNFFYISCVKVEAKR